MNKSDQSELVFQVEGILEKAFKKYEELIDELKKDEGFEPTNLTIAINDTLKNLHRKSGAYLSNKIDMQKLADEFLFERDIILDELRSGANDHVQIKRFSKRLLISFEDFLEKAPLKRRGFGRKRSRSMANISPYHKARDTAYFLWLIGGFGTLGFHRFYLGKVGSGLGWFFTGGVFGVGALYDLFTLGSQVDEHNQLAEIKGQAIRQIEGRKPRDF